MSSQGRQPVSRAGVVADAFRSQLWPLPVAAVLLAVLAGVLVPLLDQRVDDSFSAAAAQVWFGGGPDAARSVLTAVAGSLVTLTSLTFSLTVVTLQLASGQFSPRLLRTFNQDRYVHVTLALFLATFAYALTVLRTVRSAGGDGTGAEVPRIAVTLSFVLALASVVALVLFLAHLSKEIRVETMLRRVHAEGRRTLERARPERQGPVQPVELPVPPDGAVPLLAPRSGFLTSVDEQVLVDAAQAADAVLLLERPLGASLVAGTPVGWAWRASGDAPLGDELRPAVTRGLVIGHEPTGGQDITFALCQVTDVAAKALSPGVNDPRTAVHAIGHSAALIVRAMERELGPTVTCDDNDRRRLFRHQPDLTDLLDLAVSAPRRYGASDPDVLGRLFALLAEVAWCSDDPRHRTAVEGQLARLVATADEQDFDQVERTRLTELAESVRAALRGEHRSPAPPLLV